MKVVGIGLGLALVVSLAMGDNGQNPGAVFLEIGPGARATALAFAFTATADDASALYYNPAGLSFIKSNIATLMHVNWLPGLYPGMYYEYGGYAHEFPGKGTLGINAIYLTTGKTDVIDDQGNNLGSYTTFDFASEVAYGFKVMPRLGVGVGLKFIYSFLVPSWVFKAMPSLGIDNGGTGTSWAADAGILYKPWDNFSAGLSVANLGPNIAYTSSGEADPLPRMLRVGLRYSPVNSKVLQLSVMPEVEKILVGMFYDPNNTETFSQKLNYEINDAWKSLGVEATYLNFLSARVGYFEDINGARGGVVVVGSDGETQHIKFTDFLFKKNQGKFQRLGITYGGGLQFRGFAFDISFDGAIYDFPTNNMKLSASYRF